MSKEVAAFRIGLAFVRGYFYAGRNLVMDAKDTDSGIKFRTTGSGQVIAIRDREIIGGAGASVGADKLPTFEFFASADERKGQGFTKTVRQYVEQHLRSVVEALRYPKGMPSDCERIVMGATQIRELASHMNSDKAKVLPYVAEVYRKGTFRGTPDEKHPKDFSSVIYTTADVRIGQKTYRVELISKRRAKQGGVEETPYIQYGISRADVIGDAIPKICYELIGVRALQVASAES